METWNHEAWRQVLGASIEELQELLLVRDLSAPVEIYGKALLSYHQSDLLGLQSAVSALARHQGEDLESLRDLIRLRIAIRTRTSDAETADRMEASLTRVPEAFRGEICFVLALYFERQKELGRAAEFYSRAREGYLQLGLSKKAHRSAFNGLALRSRVDPSKVGIAEYAALLNPEYSPSDAAVLGQARIGISLELDRIGATQLAVKLSAEAVTLFSEELRSFNAESAELNHAYLLACNGAPKEAEPVIEGLLSSSFLEIRSCAALTANQFLGSNHPYSAEGVPPSWGFRRRRQVECQPLPRKMRPLQQALLELLLSGPKTRAEIIAVLFAEQSSPEHAQDSHRKLIQSMRKDYPDLLDCAELSQASFRPRS